MTRRLLLSYVSLTVLVVVTLEVPLAVIYAHSERQDLNAQAERAAGAVATGGADVPALLLAVADTGAICSYAMS